MKEKGFTISRIIIICIISLLFACAHHFLVIKQPWEPIKVTKKINFYNDKETTIFDFKKDTYLIKFKYVRRGYSLDDITVNNKTIMDRFLEKKEREIITNYVYVPSMMIKEGNNNFTIQFSDGYPPSVDFRIKNYRRNIEGVGYVLFHDSSFFDKRKIDFLSSLFLWLICSLALIAIFYLIRKVLSTVEKFLYRHFIFSLLPYIIFLLGVLIYNFSSKLYAVVLTNYFFWGLGIVFFIISFMSITVPKIVKKSYILLKENKVNNIGIPKVYKFINRTIVEADKASIFVILFIVLLVLSALFLLLGLKIIAGQLANIAYFSLIIGVVLKMVDFIKKKHNK